MNIKFILQQLKMNKNNIFLFNTEQISENSMNRIFKILKKNGFKCDNYYNSDIHYTIALMHNFNDLRAIPMTEKIDIIKVRYNTYNFFVIEYTDILSENTIKYINDLFKGII
jgi:hypothetical protein